MSILDRIVSDTRELIETRKRTTSLASLRGLPGYAFERRGFDQSLRDAPVAIIAELKQRSPSKGEIRSDFDVTKLASEYSHAGAAAISVLTEPYHFGGRLEYLLQARTQSVTPLLRKDFIVDPYQIVEARAYGADAVLLIATVLDPNQLAELQSACAEEGLSALVEVYAPGELDKIDIDRTPIIGANNRDLNTFEVDINRSLEVLSLLPSTVLTVAESGLANVKDVAYLINNGISAFLIGERFMIEPEPGKELSRWIAELTATK